MDPEVLEDALQNLGCAKKTKVQYFDSRDEPVNDEYLNEEGLLAKLRDLQDLVQAVPGLNATHAAPAPFILITAKGDHMYNDRPLEISRTCMREFIDGGIFSPYMLTIYNESQSHFSHRIEYDEDQDIPTAIYIFLRLPRVGKIINLTLRISLPSLTTIALLTSRIPSSIATIRARCIRQVPLLQSHPLHILNFTLERRMRDFEDWVDGLWKYVGALAQKTGVGGRWRAEGGGVRGRSKLGNEEYGGLLHDLHGVGVELRLAYTTLRFATELGEGFKKAMRTLEEARVEAGGKPAKRSVRRGWEDQVEFNETIVKTTMQKFGESIDRVQAQINVTYSLIAQKSSEQNIQIARLTAKDSQTMKTITVLTLTFLPSTMLASLWSANIFNLDADKSWRVYIGSAFGLTIVVFALWYLYVWMSRTRTPLPDTNEGQQENDKAKEV